MPVARRPWSTTSPRRGSKGVLYLLIDSTVIIVKGEAEWHGYKNVGATRRGWPKIDLGFDEEKLDVRTVVVKGSNICGAPVSPDLLIKIPAYEQIGSVTTNGAYDIRKRHDAIVDRGARAVIPLRKHIKLWKTVTADVVVRN